MAMETRSEDIVTIDREIAILRSRVVSLGRSERPGIHEDLRSLRTRRNALMPLCRTPPDTLASIIEIVAQDEQAAKEVLHVDGTNWRHIFGRSTTWMRVTSTCTYVRAVALASPFLWSDIDLNHKPPLIQLYLDRSDSALLSITCRDLPNNAALPQGLTPLLDRCRDIAVAGLGMKDAVALRKSLENPLPYLRSLHYMSPKQDLFRLSYQFLGGNTLQLTKLFLNHVILHADDLCLPNLVYLGVSGIDVQDEVERLFRLISNASQLCKVYLHGVITAQTIIKHPMDHLAHLEILHIEDSARMLGLVVPSLPLPLRDLTVSIAPTTRRGLSPVEQVMREQLLAYLFAKFPVGIRSSAALSRPRNAFSVVMRMLQLTATVPHPNIESLVLTFTDFGLKPNMFDFVLNEVPTLRVSEDLVEDVFGRSILLGANVYEHVEDIIIEASQKYSDFTRIENWLCERLVSKKQVYILDIRCPLEDRPPENQEQYTAFMQQVQSRQLVNVLLECGRPFSYHS
jgi:hypothetical protein